MLRIVNDILSTLDNDNISVLLLDLSATIDHQILLSRLNSVFGIQSTALQWFQSYRSDSYIYLILGPREKAAPPTSQQIKKFPPKRVKNLATQSSIFIFISSSSTVELCSQPIRGNVRRIGRMFPEHVERSFLNPEYSFVAVRRILPTRFAKKSSPN